MKMWLKNNRVTLGVLTLFSPIYMVIFYYAFTEAALQNDFKMLTLTILGILTTGLGLKLILGK